MLNYDTSFCNIHGWIILDKPKELSSSKAVLKAKKILNVKKAGHAGTLDPFATGVLPVALGEATKTIRFLVEKDKRYKFTVEWGKETDTDDIKGRVIKYSDVIPIKRNILKKIKLFKGITNQIPPNYSAIKVNGKRAYKIAREIYEHGNKDLKINYKSRTIRIDKFNIINHKGAETEFEITCSKGTYIRALARDLGRSLGTLAYVKQLKRLAVGKFNLENAISLDYLENLKHKDEINNLVLSFSDVLDDIPVLQINNKESEMIKFGQRLDVGEKIIKSDFKNYESAIFLICSQTTPIAFGRLEKDEIQPIKVFNFD